MQHALRVRTEKSKDERSNEQLVAIYGTKDGIKALGAALVEGKIDKIGNVWLENIQLEMDKNGNGYSHIVFKTVENIECDIYPDEPRWKGILGAISAIAFFVIGIGVFICGIAYIFEWLKK